MQIKQYLVNPPVLATLIKRKSLLLCISTTNVSLGVVMAQHNTEGKEREIYYISRTLVGYELNFIAMEKTCLAVVFATQKLRHYMLAHSVKLIAKIDPLKYLLSKATLTGRLAKWVIILSEFDIEYVDQKAIKGQIIADQLVEVPMRDEAPLHIEFLDANVLTISTKTWELFFEGSYTQHGSGARILSITPQDHTIAKSYRLFFPCTNNTVEYEALVIGIKMAIEWNIKELHVYGDS